MKRDIPLKSGDEYDAFTTWRKYYHWAPGQLREIKRKFNRRSRRVAKEKIRKERDDD